MFCSKNLYYIYLDYFIIRYLCWKKICGFVVFWTNFSFLLTVKINPAKMQKFFNSKNKFCENSTVCNTISDQKYLRRGKFRERKISRFRDFLDNLQNLKMSYASIREIKFSRNCSILSIREIKFLQNSIH